MLLPAGRRKLPTVLPAIDAATRLRTVFTKEMSILEVLESHPRAREVLEAHGMTCCLCMGASSESVEAGAIMHQVDVVAVVAELNRLESVAE